MNILLLSHVPKNPDGGASRVYHILEEALTARGHTVVLRHYEDFCPPRGILTELFMRRFALPQLVSRRVKENEIIKIDIIMSSNGMAAPLYRRFRNLPFRPVFVNHVHGLSVYDHLANFTEASLGHWGMSLWSRLFTGPLQIRWDAAGIATGDMTIVQNQRDLSYVRARLPYGLSARMIPPSVHAALLEASAEITPLQTRRKGMLIWFATWEARKGAHYIAQAFRIIRAAYPEANLVVGGTLTPAESIIAAFASEDRSAIQVLGHIPLEQQVNLFNNGSIFLFPSISEGFGLALLEALSFGLAAVTTSTGFGGDFLRDGQNARIVPASAEHLAQAVIELLDDDPKRISIAERGREIARSFTTDRMADAYESAFLDMLLVHQKNSK
jgi:glycosyltransferase involved in cell wall biosynthesis